jgi:hypothetical protein
VWGEVKAKRTRNVLGEMAATWVGAWALKRAGASVGDLAARKAVSWAVWRAGQADRGGRGGDRGEVKSATVSVVHEGQKEKKRI